MAGMSSDHAEHFEQSPMKSTTGPHSSHREQPNCYIGPTLHDAAAVCRFLNCDEHGFETLAILLPSKLNTCGSNIWVQKIR
jgi:hypothetical protein